MPGYFIWLWQSRDRLLGLYVLSLIVLDNFFLLDKTESTPIYKRVMRPCSYVQNGKMMKQSQNGMLLKDLNFSIEAKAASRNQIHARWTANLLRTFGGAWVTNERSPGRSFKTMAVAA